MGWCERADNNKNEEAYQDVLLGEHALEAEPVVQGDGEAGEAGSGPGFVEDVQSDQTGGCGMQVELDGVAATGHSADAVVAAAVTASQQQAVVQLPTTLRPTDEFEVAHVHLAGGQKVRQAHIRAGATMIRGL